MTHKMLYVSLSVVNYINHKLKSKPSLTYVGEIDELLHEDITINIFAHFN